MRNKFRAATKTKDQPRSTHRFPFLRCQPLPFSRDGAIVPLTKAIQPSAIIFHPTPLFRSLPSPAPMSLKSRHKMSSPPEIQPTTIGVCRKPELSSSPSRRNPTSEPPLLRKKTMYMSHPIKTSLSNAGIMIKSQTSRRNRQREARQEEKKRGIKSCASLPETVA
ncbi:hypothetical protein B0T16DRAFT_97010 [Cercophora newfieldiana]|uniref:Uncharacterized protein n=1 Tax=Cercophora newfieldiana TaxID=92897 RepID=A0AA39YGZ3_9PEZI|nr:hypothetical protein B0T16DRAFT_97010 [Cercophora newfieldiana]